MRKFTNIFIIIILSAALTACFGGDGDSGNTQNEDPSSSQNGEVALTEGGSPSDPAAISLDGPNEIKSDEFFNNYIIKLQEGDELIIIVTLENFIDLTRSTRRDYTGIRGENIRTTTRYLRYSPDKAEELTLKFGYPNNNYGVFHAAVIKNGEEPDLLSISGEGGAPDALGSILIDGKNELSGNSFFNNYGYRGNKGETIYLQAYVDPSEPRQTITRCAAGAGFASRDGVGWIVLDSDKPRSRCSDSLEYTFEEDGLYRFHFRSTVYGDGFFRATVTPSPL